MVNKAAELINSPLDQVTQKQVTKADGASFEAAMFALQVCTYAHSVMGTNTQTLAQDSC